MRIADFGMKNQKPKSRIYKKRDRPDTCLFSIIVDCGMKPNPQSKIQNPKSH